MNLSFVPNEKLFLLATVFYIPIGLTSDLIIAPLQLPPYIINDIAKTLDNKQHFIAVYY